jgi:phospholipid/cholesterol/gamma-HCH transport system permease protein
VSETTTAALPDAEPRVGQNEVAVETLGALLSGRLDLAELGEQIRELTLRTVPVGLLSLAFIGAVLEEHAAREARRALVGLSQLGPIFMQLTVREFAPVLAGLLLAARAGSGIAAEIGWMAQTEQLDALRLSGRDAAAELFAPRLAATLLASVVVSFLGIAAASLSAGLFAHAQAGASLSSFLSFQLLDRRDILMFAFKTLANGVAVPLAAIHAGLELGRKPDGVARATAAGVVRGTLWVLGADVAIGASLWWLP